MESQAIFQAEIKKKFLLNWAPALVVLPLVASAVRVLAMGVVVAAGRDCRRLLSSVWSRLPMVSRGGLAWAEALWIPVDAVEEVLRF